jgi:hypothetical protein
MVVYGTSIPSQRGSEQQPTYRTWSLVIWNSIE